MYFQFNKKVKQITWTESVIEFKKSEFIKFIRSIFMLTLFEINKKWKLFPTECCKPPTTTERKYIYIKYYKT